MHFCFNEFMFTDILLLFSLQCICYLFAGAFLNQKNRLTCSNSLLFQLVKLFNMLHALVAVENVFCPFTVNFKKAL